MALNQQTKRSNQASVQKLAQKVAQKHVPMRRCVLCRQSKAQTELIRFYKSETGSWELDKHHLLRAKIVSEPKSSISKPSGRGVWVCFESSCHNPKKIAYAFKQKANDIETHLKRYANKENSENASTGTDLTEKEKFQSGGMNV